MAPNLPANWRRNAKSKSPEKGKAIPRASIDSSTASSSENAASGDSSTSQSSKTTTKFSKDARCFIPERRENGVFHVLDPQYTRDQRKQICRHLPEILKSNYLLTAKELSDCGWQETKSGELHSKECAKGSYPYAMFAGPEYIKKLDLIPKMTRLQEIVTDPEFQKFLVKQQRSGKKKSGAYNMAASIQYPPSKDYARIQLGRHARARNPLAEEHNRLCTHVAAVVLDDFYSKDIKDVLVRRSKIQAAMSCGAHYNPYTNQIQINLSPVDGSKLSNSIGDVGCTHVDEHDDPTRHTVVLSLSHISDQTFPGRFNMLALKLTCTMPPFSALVLPGVDAHVGTGVGPYPLDLPIDSPRRYRYPKGFVPPRLPKDVPFIRANDVVYPNKVLSENNHKIHGEFKEAGGIAQFLDEESHAEWKVQSFVKNLLENPGPDLVIPSAEEITRMFSWKDSDGKTRFPHRSIAEDCLSYDRQNDPAFNRIVAITEMTATGLPKIWEEKDEAEKKKATERYRRRKAREAAKRDGTILPPSVRSTVRKITKSANKTKAGAAAVLAGSSETLAVSASKDLTIWTHEDQVRSYSVDPDVDTIPGNQ